MKVILLGGKKRSGKGVSATIVQTYYEEKGFSVYKTSFAEPIKEILSIMFDIPVSLINRYKNNPDKFKITIENTENATDFRQLLQKLGTEVRDQYLYQTIWVDLCISKIKRKNTDIAIIDDWRFPFEYSILCENFDVLPIIVTRDTDEEDNHPSEKSLDDVSYATIIDNNGTIPELKDKLLKEII